ncbi:MAG: hypothetical protein GF388_08230 [Candidatus Aegiribacteria sp.]|nr:hypothetical protein [Candidatus Aegiribacteria sp.]MBD3295073.1 hypothetical protein [Candidatus Fermentibacteria bacterium]
MKLFVTGITLMIAAAVMIGCGESSTGPSEEGSNYFPMQEGDWWEYSYTATRVSPDTLLWEEGSTYYDVLSVSGDTCRVQKTLKLWTINGQQQDTTVNYDTLTWISNSDSLVFLFNNGTGIKYLDLPLYVGKTWDDWTVESLSEEVTTPAGTFTDCALVTTPNTPYNTDTCFEYCPDIGEVRRYEKYSQLTGSTNAYDIFFNLTGSSYLQ